MILYYYYYYGYDLRRPLMQSPTRIGENGFRPLMSEGFHGVFFDVHASIYVR